MSSSLFESSVFLADLSVVNFRPNGQVGASWRGGGGGGAESGQQLRDPWRCFVSSVARETTLLFFSFDKPENSFALNSFYVS